MQFGAWIIRTAAIIILVTLCGCGGGGNGGGGDDPAPALPGTPSLTLTPQNIKTLNFTWTDVGGETEYRLLEDATGSSGYSQVATIFADETSYEHEIFLPGRINAGYILQACNSAGCSDSDAVYAGDLADAIGYVKASNTGSQNWFGVSMALSVDGSTLAVGAAGEAGKSGAVYVFTRSGSTWSQQAYIKASNQETNDYFGVSVALSADGSTLAVGAHFEDSRANGIEGDEADNTAPDSGAVYVFTRSGSTWNQQAYVKASNTGEDDRFGYSVALAADGSTLAVGAIQEDYIEELVSNSGAVYVFIRSGSAWSQQAYVKASTIEGGDNFGWSVALAADGSTLAVGALYGEGSSAGAVYVLTRSGSTWSQQAFVQASNADIDDYFGASVALSADGSILAVGADGEDSGATGIDGNQTDNTATDCGAVYLFTRSGSTWSQQAYIKASNAEALDHFGCRVALSSDGSTLAVGAGGEDSTATGIDGSQTDDFATQSGAVYVFSRSGSSWSQQAYVKASNTGTGDGFGWSAALAADGNTLAVGAHREQSNATGIGGDQADDSVNQSGAVYLY